MRLIHVRRGWEPLDTVGRQTNRVLQFNLESHGTLPRLESRHPLLNMLESDDEYIATVELPGVRPEEIELSVTEESLLLAGNRKPTEGVSDESYRRQERWTGPWQRELFFPTRVNADAVKAAMANGTLTVRIPKAADLKRRRVAILPTSS